MSMEYYRGMLVQRPRMEAFRRRIHEVVDADTTVVEIGTGLGTYACFAAEAGARQVVAVEGGPIVHVARELARENGREVEFVQGWFPYVPLPESADVVIYEDFPARFLDPTSFRILNAIHHGLLKPGGTLVPGAVRIAAVPVYTPTNWRVMGPLLESDPATLAEPAYGMDWQLTRELASHRPSQMPLRPEDLRGDPVHGEPISLSPTPAPADLAYRGEWTYAEDTVIHGLAYWFEMEVEGGSWLTNEPGKEPGSWGYLYLPLDEEWTVPAGTRLDVRVAPETTASGGPGWLTWSLECGDQRYLGHEFRSILADPQSVVAASSSWAPRLGQQGELARRVLQLVDGHRSLREIAEVLAVEAGLDQIESERRTREILMEFTVQPGSQGEEQGR